MNRKRHARPHSAIALDHLICAYNQLRPHAPDKLWMLTKTSDMRRNGLGDVYICEVVCHHINNGIKRDQWRD